MMKRIPSCIVSVLLIGLMGAITPLAEARDTSRTKSARDASGIISGRNPQGNGGVISGEQKPQKKERKKIRKSRLSKKKHHTRKNKSAASRDHNQYKRTHGFPKRWHDRQGAPVEH